MSSTAQAGGNAEAKSPPASDASIVKMVEELLGVLKGAEKPAAAADDKGAGDKGAAKPEDKPAATVAAQKMDPIDMVKKLVMALQQWIAHAGGGGQGAAVESAARKSADEPQGLRVDILPSGQIVVKGGQVSGERIERFKTALAGLQAVLQEIDPSAAAALQGAAGGAVAKAAGGEDALGRIEKALTSIGERIAAVEKGQAVSKGLPEGGTDDVKDTKKAESPWKGVL